MESIKGFLDTDVLLNWLCKEVTADGKNLWEAPYKILKIAEEGNILLYTTLINLMEIRFVLRRKKKWAESEIEGVIKEIGEVNNIEIIIPDGGDLVAGFNLQSLYMLDPFDAVYLGVASKISSFIISRDRDFINIANRIKEERLAFDPEAFLESIEKELLK